MSRVIKTMAKLENKVHHWRKNQQHCRSGERRGEKEVESRSVWPEPKPGPFSPLFGPHQERLATLGLPLSAPSHNSQNTHLDRQGGRERRRDWGLGRETEREKHWAKNERKREREWKSCCGWVSETLTLFTSLLSVCNIYSQTITDRQTDMLKSEWTKSGLWDSLRKITKKNSIVKVLTVFWWIVHHLFYDRCSKKRIVIWLL